MADDLLPLPLSPFEFYYWCDDRPDYPTTFPVELLFRGPLRRKELEDALQVCLDRHPLLNANVDVSTGKIPSWVPAECRSLPLDWADWSTPIDHAAGRFIDLTTEVGVRLWVRTSAERSRLVLQFHHACCDALGGLQFFEELLVIYDSLIAGTDPRSLLRRLDPQRLLLRSDYGLTKANYRPNLRDTLTTLRYWSWNLMRRPALLAVPDQDHAPPAEKEADLGYVTHTLTKEDRHHLQTRASRGNATINDLMLRDLLMTLRDWNHEHGGDVRRLVINVPVSLRTRVDQQMPATNVLGFWFLERRISDCRDADRLLGGIRDEMEAVRKWRLPLYFIGGLRYACKFPGKMRQVLRSRRSFATIVFSNAGRLMARTSLKRQDRKLICGNVLLERITGVPPVRPGTRAAIIVAHYGYDTYVNLQWDPHVLNESAARLLLDKYIQRLMGDS